MLSLSHSLIRLLIEGRTLTASRDRALEFRLGMNSLMEKNWSQVTISWSKYVWSIRSQGLRYAELEPLQKGQRQPTISACSCQSNGFIVNQYNNLVHKRSYTLSILANRKYLALCESLSFVCLADDDLISRRPNQSTPLAANKHPLLINKTWIERSDWCSLMRAKPLSGFGK